MKFLSVSEICEQSVIQDPSPPIATQVIELLSSVPPVTYTLDELADSGTQMLQANGLVGETCGTMIYTMASS